MTRWIASDESTASALRAREVAADVGSRDAIGDAIAAGSTIVVLPAPSGVLVARIRPTTQPAAFEVHRWTDEDAVGYTAGGMLGLRDEPVYDEQPQPSKKWWRRILD